jgi:outer membrane receptor for ferrienterochelin and colicins
LPSASIQSIRMKRFANSLPALLTLLALSTSVLAAESDAEPEPALQEVVVTTTRTARRIADEPTRIEVIDREELDEKVAMSPGDVAMLLNETSGLRVQTTSPALGAANVRIQGLRGRYSQVLADGLPLYGGQTGGIGLLQVPPLDLGQVEVLKGVASALYGASALGGVINLVSRRPDGAHELLFNQTSRGGTDAALWWAGAPSKQGWSYSLIGVVDRQTTQDVDGDGWADIPRFRRGTIRPRLYWADGAGRELFLTAGAMLEDRSGGTVKDGLVPVSDPVGTSFVEALKTERFDMALTGRWPISPERTLTVRASAMQRDQRQTFGTDVEPTRSRTAFAEVALNGVDGRNDWVAGLALQQDRYRNQNLPAFDFAYTAPGLFVQDEYRASDALTLSASARLDHHNVYGTFLSPRVAVLWRPGGADSPWRSRVSLGTGFFSPTPITEETESTGLARLLPLEGLQAEQARGLSADLGRLWRVGHGSVEGNATVFASEVEHAVGLAQVTATPPQFALVNANAPTRTVGTELLFRWHSRPFTATVAHAYINATELTPGTLVRRMVPLNPRHSATFTAVWEDEEIGRVGIEGFFTGRQSLIDNPYRSESASIVTFGFLVERRFGAAKVFLNAENLTDRRLTRFQPLVLPERAHDGRWTTDAWASLDGRVINLGVRWQFGAQAHEEDETKETGNAARP